MLLGLWTRPRHGPQLHLSPTVQNGVVEATEVGLWGVVLVDIPGVFLGQNPCQNRS